MWESMFEEKEENKKEVDEESGEGKRRRKDKKEKISAHLYGCWFTVILSWLGKKKHSHKEANLPFSH